MYRIGMILFVLGFAFLIYGFVRPHKALFWVKGTRTRKKSILIYGLMFIVGIILIGLSPMFG